MEARKIAFSPSTLRKGWEKAGIFPRDPEVPIARTARIGYGGEEIQKRYHQRREDTVPNSPNKRQKLLAFCRENRVTPVVHEKLFYFQTKIDESGAREAAKDDEIASLKFRIQELESQLGPRKRRRIQESPNSKIMGRRHLAIARRESLSPTSRGIPIIEDEEAEEI